jgi:HEAT repeat protein
VPELQRGLDLKGGSAHGRRLRALCAIDPRLGTALSRQALAEGNIGVRTQALRSLTRLAPADAERGALEALGSKPQWRLAQVALQALAGSHSDAALEALLRALVSEEGHSEIADDVLTAQPHPRATARLTEVLAELCRAEAEAVASAKVKKPSAPGKGRKGQPAAPDPDEVRYRLARVISVLGSRKDPAALPALVALLDHRDAGVRETAVEALCTLGHPDSLRAAADRMDDGKVWESAARAAWLLPEPERYDRLAPLVEELSKPKKSDHRRGKFVLDLFEDEFSGDDLDEEDPSAAPRDPRTDWDRRWVPLLRKYLNGPYRPDAALGLAAVLGEPAVAELLPLLVPSVKKNECGVVEALGHLKAREAVAAMVPLMPGQPSHHYCIHAALRRINDPAAIPLLEGVLAKTKDRYRRDRITDVIEHLEQHRAEA